LRATLAAAVGVALVVPPSCVPVPSDVRSWQFGHVSTDAADRPLKDVAAGLGKTIGAGVTSDGLREPAYSTVLDREFNSITPSHEMKWRTIEPTRGTRNFVPGDAIVSYAERRGMEVRGHTLLWHVSVPPWVSTLAAPELRLAVAEHVRETVAHYRGRVRSWDVVNEAVADDGPGLRDSVYLRGLGENFVADAFRLAHEVDPGALLFYNDYGGEGLGAKSDRIYKLVRDLKMNGIPIHGVGLQMHVSARNRPSDASIAANVRRLADLGLWVRITEMDVKSNGVWGWQQVRLDAQRAAYRAIVRLCAIESRCDGVTIWGVTDAYTWLTGESPLLFDAQYRPKPAYFGVLDALSGR
jgi:endo-1,4-beta-xylanase